MMHWLVAATAAALVFLVFMEAFEVMLLPRRVTRRFHFVGLYFRTLWSVWCAVARRLREGSQREGFLSVFGPFAMVLLFAVWAVLLILGFGTLNWSLEGDDPSAWFDQIYLSGVTFFTLGYGDIAPKAAFARMVSVFEAGSGLGFIALVIGYLPVLYQMFARRETHVIQLDARAGSPPTAVGLLQRHTDREGLQKLDGLLHEWEIWASELLESHLSYPMLAYYRSQHDNHSWLAALTAIMDTCALILVGVEEMHPLQARMTFTAARLIMVEMARSFRAKPASFTGGSRLDDEGFARLDVELSGARIGWQGGAVAQANLAALRATYEPLLHGLSVDLLLPLPGFMPAEHAEDHWERGHRGETFSKLIAELSDTSPQKPAAR